MGLILQSFVSKSAKPIIDRGELYFASHSLSKYINIDTTQKTGAILGVPMML